MKKNVCVQVKTNKPRQECVLKPRQECDILESSETYEQCGVVRTQPETVERCRAEVSPHFIVCIWPQENCYKMKMSGGSKGFY